MPYRDESQWRELLTISKNDDNKLWYIKAWGTNFILNNSIFVHGPIDKVLKVFKTATNDTAKQKITVNFRTLKTDSAFVDTSTIAEGDHYYRLVIEYMSSDNITSILLVKVEVTPP